MKRQEFQGNFTAGALSPRLYAHVDVDKYKNGLKTAENCIILPHGPVRRRNGSKFVNEVKTSSAFTRLLRFQFDQTNAYILEFGNLYIRFYRAGAILGAPYEVTTTYTTAELPELSYVQFGNTIYIAHSNHAPAKLVWSSDTSWALSDIRFYPPATEEVGYSPALTITPAATTGLAQNFTASGAVFLAGDIGRQIVNLVGTGKASIISITSTTVAVCDIVEDFPNTTAIASGNWKLDLSPIVKLTMDGSAEGQTVTINSFYTDSSRGSPKTITAITAANPGVVTSAAHGFENGDKVEIRNVLGMTQVNNRVWTVKGKTADTFILANDDNASFDTSAYTVYVSGGTAKRVLTDIGKDAFRAADVGKYIVMHNGVGIITAVTNAQAIKVSMQKSMDSVAATSLWSIETPAWTSTNGYPRAIALHEQRLWFGSTDAGPQSLWASETGIFDSFGVGSGDADGLQLELSTKEVNQVNWMVGLRNDLAVGTAGAELTVNSGSSNGGITPSSVTQETRSYNGSNIQQALGINNEILYIQRSSRKIMSFFFDFNVDNYKSQDLAFLAEHLTVGGVRELAYAQDPDGTIYAVLNDGNMLVGTYLRDQQVLGWTEYQTDGLYESVQTISTGQYDEVYVIVKRTIGGAIKRYVERFDLSDGSDNLDGFSDSYLTYSLPKTITNITQASVAVVTSVLHGFSNGDRIKIIDVEGMTQVNGRTYLVANQAANTFELTTTAGVNIDSTAYTAYTSGGEAHELVTVISNLSHLEGKTVQVKTDGAVHPDEVVVSGAITLQAPAYEVTVGLPYTTLVETLNKEYNIGQGTQQGQQVRWVRPILRLYQSALPTVNTEFLPARTPPDLMDRKLPLFDGDAVYGPLSWSETGIFEIEISLPFPMMLLGIFGSLDAGSQ